ncbi:MAG: hypothetical protein CM1200mP16_00620 [Nitrospina sp.]|nr:MAG: hypothetical protein CM1200mP16_00620 [Nitrospina sp.]
MVCWNRITQEERDGIRKGGIWRPLFMQVKTEMEKLAADENFSRPLWRFAA